MASKGCLGVHPSRDPALRLFWLSLTVRRSVSRNGFLIQQDLGELCALRGPEPLLQIFSHLHYPAICEAFSLII